MTRSMRWPVPLLVGTWAVLWPGSLRAEPYPVPIEVQDEVELDQLYYDGEVSEEERDRLRGLFRHPVDLNRAGRDDLYRLPGVTFEMADAILAFRTSQGPFRAPEDLAQVPEVPPEVLRQVLPFVEAQVTPEPKPWRARMGAAAIWRDQLPDPSGHLPGIVLDNRVDFLRFGSAGAVITVRPRLGPVHDAPPGGSLSAEGERLRLDPGALWLAWDGPRWSGILGHYRVGFGLGLTMDTTRQALPTGWTEADEVVWDLQGGDATPWKGFFGLAARARQIDLPKGWLDLTVFASHQHRDLYFTEAVYDRCPADRPDCSEGARLPQVVDTRCTTDPEAGQTGCPSLYCQYPTLPEVLREVVAGGHLAWWLDPRIAIGATGTVTWLQWRIDAKDLHLSPSSKYPEDRPLFGAAGMDFRAGRGPFDLLGEATVTDRGAGAAVALARWRIVPGLEVEPSFRWFSPEFDNPWNGASANGDERLGNRGRDELGGRLRVQWKAHPVIRIRGDLDVWHHRRSNLSCDPSASPDSPEACTDQTRTLDRPTTDLWALLRLDLTPSRHERLSLQASYADEDLSRSGRRLSYQPYQNSQGDFSGGSKVSWAFQATTTRIPRTTVSVFVRHFLEDVYALTRSFDQSWYAWLRVSTNLSPGPSLSLRLKFQDDSAVADPDRSASQLCDDETRGEDHPATLPASCRGQSFFETTLWARQRIVLGPTTRLWIILRGQWTRFVDHRSRWTTGTSCEDHPERDQLGLQGSLAVEF